MTGRETGALVIVAGLVLLAIAVAGWLLRPAGGRHEQREQAGEAEAKAFVAELRGLPADGKDMYTDHTVRLPRTPPPPGRTLWQPPWPAAQLHEPAAERQASDTDVRAAVAEEPDGFVEFTGDVSPDLLEHLRQRLVSAADARAVTCAAPARPASMQPEPVANSVANPAGVIPEWVRAALGGHDGVDACVESIVARSVTDA